MYRNKNPVNQAFWSILSCFSSGKLIRKMSHPEALIARFCWAPQRSQNKKAPENRRLLDMPKFA